MQCVIIVTGLSGSGKTTIVQLLQRLLPGDVQVASSEIILAELVQKGQKPDEYSIRKHATAQMLRYGAHYWTQRSVELYLPSHGYLIIDGIRNDTGIRWLKASDLRSYVIGVQTDFETCVKRFAKRPRHGKPPMDEPDARAHLTEEVTPGPEWGLRLDACMALADAIIDGNQDIDHVERQLDPIIKEILERTRE